jgi:hypothetical protein
MCAIYRASGLAVLIFLALGSASMARGPGNGLGRALGQAGGQGKAASGLGRAGQNLSRLGSTGRAAGLGRATNARRGPFAEKRGGWWKSRAAAPEAPSGDEDLLPHQRQIDIEMANRDHRLGQAEHLRELSERNGNPALGANADRMESFADEHYQERVEHWGGILPADETSALGGTSSSPDYADSETGRWGDRGEPADAGGKAGHFEAGGGMHWLRSWWPGRR